ncbi:MAG: NAD(P)/FAD-dependent oxidoreductase [Candidatus Aenigmatarchaeota archaeon]
MFDIIVIGAGPIGLYSAYLCENLGYKVLVIEEDEEIGKPLKCSGLISRNIKKFFSDIENWDVVENEVSCAILHSKNIELKLKKDKAAYVINRSLFDKKISELINSEIKLKCKAEKIFFEKGSCVKIKTNKGSFETETVLFCDGPNSICNLSKTKILVKGVFGLINKKNYDNYVDLYFNKKELKDGFFWKIPRGEKTEYGLWGKNANFDMLENFFKIKVHEKHAGLIPIKSVIKSYGERFLLIGGSAGQNKPWSGGGVIYGLLCAQIAAKVIEKAFRFNNFSESILKEYEDEWKRKIGKQIKLGMIFRKIFEISNDFELDLIFSMAKFLDYSWMDMDFIW